MKRLAFLLLVSLFLAAVAASAYAHEGEEPEKVQKVTSETMGRESSQGKSEGLAQQSGHDEKAAQAMMAKDFQTIRKEVSSSAIFIVIKALALAIAIAGIALVYLKRGAAGEAPHED
jgi:hypothetical protein